MGANNSSHERAHNFNQMIDDVQRANAVTKNIKDAYGNKLHFELIPAHAKDLLMPMFWRKLVNVKVTRIPNSDKSPILLNYVAFYVVFSRINEQGLDRGESPPNASTSMLVADNDSDHKECVICFERKPDTVLSCSHAFCNECLQSWNAQLHHDDCPMCRVSGVKDDAWVLADKPSSEEMFAFFSGFIEDVSKTQNN